MIDILFITVCVELVLIGAYAVFMWVYDDLEVYFSFTKSIFYYHRFKKVYGREYVSHKTKKIYTHYVTVGVMFVRIRFHWRDRF